MRSLVGLRHLKKVVNNNKGTNVHNKYSTNNKPEKQLARYQISLIHMIHELIELWKDRAKIMLKVQVDP